VTRIASAWRVALALAATGLLAAAPATAVDYGDYHTFAEVEQQLQAWAQAHPDLVRTTAFGESAGGRKLWVAEIAAAGPVPPGQRPAVFVGANIAGFHNAGTEAVLDLVSRLVAGAAGDLAGLLSSTTFYVAPALDPDAQDALFAPVRVRRGGDDGRLDRDHDGLSAEDGYEDLDGDGRITRVRIPDPAGAWLPHPDEPRLMVKADPSRGWTGAYRVESEGSDSDGDGSYNEDPEGGVVPDRDFAHAFPYHDVEAGLWPSIAPETKAVMDFLLAHRNVALAVTYGPANNLLALPQGFGGGGDLGTQKFKVPKEAAEFIGLDPEVEYTLDEVWEAVKDLPFVRQNSITKEQVAQFLGVGPATKLEDDDQALLTHLAKDYKERLKKAGLDADWPAEQYRRGGFTPWLYYQYGALAMELDVWGVPKKKEEKAEGKEGAEAPLTLDRLEKMSAEEFLALPEEKVAAFLKEIGAPPQFTAAALTERVRSGQVTPEQMATMARQMGGGAEAGGEGGGDKDPPQVARRREVLAWIDANAPEAVAPWKAVTLADGTHAEAGGVDPFIEVAPPYAILAPALAAHTDEVLDLAGKLARVEIASLTADDLGGGVFRVRAVAANRGELPTHTAMAKRARAHLPLRLELVPGAGAELVTGRRAITSERLEGAGSTLEGEWLVRADRGAQVAVKLHSDNAGSDEKSLTLGKGK
jgi:Zinc carboxypeptidase